MSRHDDNTTRGFRPSTRRRNRIAAGVALGAAAIGGNVLVYSSLDSSDTAVQALRDIPAGTEITPDMIRTVDADLDATVLAVPGEQLALVPGQYARVRIVSGSLLVQPALQSGPLVADDAAIVAVEVPPGLIPRGVRERSRVDLVFDSISGEQTVVAGQTVGIPDPSIASSGSVSISIEVDADSAAAVAAADDVRVVLLTPQPGDS